MKIHRYCWTLVVGLIIVYIFITFWSAAPMPIIKRDISPLHEKEEDSSPLTSPLLLPFPMSKDLIVFSAHLDNRPQRIHNNITMIFIGASKKVFELKMIIGCGVGSAVASDFNVRYVYEDNLMHRWLGKYKYRYEQLVVECYDLPIVPGDKAFVIYRASPSDMVAVHTIKQVTIPGPRISPKGRHNFSVVVCTKAHTRGVTWLPEFLRYQKTLGVDHVHLTILDEFIKDEGFRDYLSNDSFFFNHVKDNYISVQVWKEWYADKEWYVHGTILMYLDCLYRYRGTYDFVSFMDTDDFFTVRVPGMTYKDVIEKYCLKRTIGSCTFTWLFYYPGICGLKKKIGEDGNVTAVIVPHKGVKEQDNLKSIHFSEAVVDSSFHEAKCRTCLLKGYKVMHVPQRVAYVAHHRLYVENKKKKKVCRKH